MPETKMNEPIYWRYAVLWIDPAAVCNPRIQYSATLEESQAEAAEQIRNGMKSVQIVGVLWEQTGEIK